MDKKKRTKHVPKNSAFIIGKFETHNQLLKLMHDEKFQLFKSKLEILAVEKGGKCEFFSHK